MTISDNGWRMVGDATILKRSYVSSIIENLKDLGKFTELPHSFMTLGKDLFMDNIPSLKSGSIQRFTKMSNSYSVLEAKEATLPETTVTLVDRRYEDKQIVNHQRIRWMTTAVVFSCLQWYLEGAKSGCLLVLSSAQHSKFFLYADEFFKHTCSNQKHGVHCRNELADVRHYNKEYFK